MANSEISLEFIFYLLNLVKLLSNFQHQNPSNYEQF